MSSLYGSANQHKSDSAEKGKNVDADLAEHEFRPGLYLGFLVGGGGGGGGGRVVVDADEEKPLRMKHTLFG